MKIITQSSWFEDDEPRRLKIECDEDMCKIDADDVTMSKLLDALERESESEID